MTETQIAAAVAQGARLKDEIRVRTDELKDLEKQLIACGAGKYEGLHGEECNVIAPGPGIKPGDEDIAACKEIAGEHFGKLFEKVTSFKPVKSFREVAAALLTKAKCAKVIAAVEKASSPFVKWAK